MRNEIEDILYISLLFFLRKEYGNNNNKRPNSLCCFRMLIVALGTLHDPINAARAADFACLTFNCWRLLYNDNLVRSAACYIKDAWKISLAVAVQGNIFCTLNSTAAMIRHLNGK